MELVQAFNDQQKRFVFNLVKKRVLRKKRTYALVKCYYTLFFAGGLLFEARMLPMSFSVSYYYAANRDPVLCYQERVYRFSKRVFEVKFLSYLNLLYNDFVAAIKDRLPFSHIPRRWVVFAAFNEEVKNPAVFDCCGGLFFANGRLRRTLHHLGARRR